jgi:hypothetical protein
MIATRERKVKPPEAYGFRGLYLPILGFAAFETIEALEIGNISWGEG